MTLPHPTQVTESGSVFTEGVTGEQDTSWPCWPHSWHRALGSPRKQTLHCLNKVNVGWDLSAGMPRPFKYEGLEWSASATIAPEVRPSDGHSGAGRGLG